VRAPDGANESPGGGAGARSAKRMGSRVPTTRTGRPCRSLEIFAICKTTATASRRQRQRRSVAYSHDLSGVLQANNKVYEYYEYEGGEHNIESPYFETAMLRTIEFFQKYL